MSAPQTDGNQSVDIRKGNSCLLSVTGRHFMVEITEVGEDSMRVSFPGIDYPVEGMNVELEFHDETGFVYYRVEVLEGPWDGEGVLVTRPREAKRNQHRDAFRVPTDLTVQVRDHVHVRKYDADLLDLSSGGSLLQTEAPFDFNTTINISLSLPGESTHEVTAHVVHVVEQDRTKRGPARIYGVKFIGTPPETCHAISRYVWTRLRELYPA